MSVTVRIDLPTDAALLRAALDLAEAMADTVQVTADDGSLVLDLVGALPHRRVSIVTDDLGTPGVWQTTTEEAPAEPVDDPEADQVSDPDPAPPAAPPPRPDPAGSPGEPETIQEDSDPDLAPDPAGAPEAPSARGEAKRRILDYLLDHGAVGDPDRGNATAVLADRVGARNGSGWQRHLKELADEGLILRQMPTPRSTTKITASDAAAEARRVGLPPYESSSKDQVLDCLAEHGPVFDIGGHAAAVLAGLAGLTIKPTARSELLRDLEVAGLIECDRSATAIYRIRLAPRAAPATEGALRETRNEEPRTSAAGPDDGDDGDEDGDENEDLFAIPEAPRWGRGTVAWRLLTEVADDDGHFDGSIRDLAEAIGGPGLANAGVVRALEGAGLVTINRPTPRRSNWVALTTAGWAHIGRARPVGGGPARAADPETAAGATDDDAVRDPAEPEVDWAFMRRRGPRAGAPGRRDDPAAAPPKSSARAAAVGQPKTVTRRPVDPPAPLPPAPSGKKANLLDGPTRIDDGHSGFRVVEVVEEAP